jgi:hypothetical protein
MQNLTKISSHGAIISKFLFAFMKIFNSEPRVARSGGRGEPLAETQALDPRTNACHRQKANAD